MNNIQSNQEYKIIPINNLYQYIKYVKSIPNLSDEEEQSLVLDYKKNNSLTSAQKLILPYLKTVVTISNQYSNYGLPQEDLIQEGNIGLMKAVKNFNPSNKNRLYAYAILWIKSEMQSYILKNWKIVKIATTKNLKKLFFNFRKIQHEMIAQGIDKKELIPYISKKLNVTEKDVKDMANYFGTENYNIDMDEKESDENNKHHVELIEYKTPEDELHIKNDEQKISLIVNDLLPKLNDKQQKIIQMRFFNEPKKTHKEISKILNISSERVRQIENEALGKLKTNYLEQYQY